MSVKATIKDSNTWRETIQLQCQHLLQPAVPQEAANPPNTSPARKHTQHKIPTLKIIDEIKYLHSKKKK